MGYLMWRDTKSALILFSRRKDFSNVLEVVRETVIKHPLYIRTLKTATAIETLFRYEFKQQNDPKRRLLLSVLVFNIPTE